MPLALKAARMISKAIYEQSKEVLERLAKSEICLVIFGINLVVCWGLADIQAWIFKAFTNN